MKKKKLNFFSFEIQIEFSTNFYDQNMFDAFQDQNFR